MFSLNDLQINTKEDLLKFSTNKLFEKEIFKFLNNWYDDSLTIETKTSGSTGRPKTIKLQKSSMLKSAELTCSFFNLRKEQTALLCLPTNFIAGKMMLVRAAYAQLKIISVAPSRNPLKYVSHKIDFAAMTPMQVNTILIETPLKLNLIKTLIIGGAPVSTFLESKLKSYKTECFSTFGMTETITHVALKKLNRDDFFSALSDVSFSITTDDCLIIKANYISSKPIVTTDKVTLLSPTQFIWKGRKNNVINSGGIKIQAEELEKKIGQLIPKNRFFITTKKDELLGEKIILIIESNIDINISEINFKSLDKYSIPKEIYTLSKFKETETGKILREENKALLQLK